MIYQPLERAGLIERCRIPKAEIRDLLELAFFTQPLSPRSKQKLTDSIESARNVTGPSIA
jgi:hypothetical protein